MKTPPAVPEADGLGAGVGVGALLMRLEGWDQLVEGLGRQNTEIPNKVFLYFA